MRLHARQATGVADAPPDLAPFVAFQRWLALAGKRRVIVPYAEGLMDRIPARLVRMRRDGQQLLSCIQAVALLYQRQRERASDGSIIAEITDYEIARDLLAPVFDTIASEGVSPAVRETVEAVAEGEEVTAAEIARRLKMAKSSITYRVGRALHGGWLVNNEPNEHRPKRLTRGAPLPEARPALPDPDEVRRGFEGTNGIRETEPPSPLAAVAGAAGGRTKGEPWEAVIP